MTIDNTGTISGGRRFEVSIFGETNLLSEGEAMRIPQYSFEESLAQAEEALKTKGWNPHSPPTMAAFNLQQAVQNALRLTPPQKVEFANALGTSIDIHWGVDGYFKISNTHIVVTVDLTTSPDKIRSGKMKADLLLTPSDVLSPQALSVFASKVAHLLRKRYKGFEHQQA